MYRTADMPPPYNVRVWLAWPGWLGEGARVKGSGRPGTKGERWVTWQERRVAMLPPASVRDAQGHVRAGYERPDLWAPLNPEQWRLALPEAVTTHWQGRMWSSRQSYDAVAAAEEAEGERSGKVSEPAAGRRRQWWRDATLISYSAAGSITRREAEGRVMRALASDPFARWGHGTGLHRADLRFMALTDDDKRAEAERAAAEVADIVEPFRALPQDHRDYDAAMGWFASTCRYSTYYRAVITNHPVLLLAVDDRALSWREMADTMRVSRQAALQQYRAGLNDIWLIANGFAHEGAQRRTERLAELRANLRRQRESA
jgi:hypothetical protein